jgi:hypothetical protein
LTDAEKIQKLEKQVARLKKRLREKIKYEQDYLTSATPAFRAKIQEKDKAVLEE